ncbi:CRISPR-associated endonuclease Cas2 [Candidatus Gottesmanbacteria bacterium]|nr:CRISPR-associated endonuclease Cas2 [Candidatus Gottesmanbacteria bacterium]
MRRKEFRDIALKLSDGLLQTATDTVLFTLFLMLCSFGKSKTSVGTHQMFDEASLWLQDFNYKTIKNAITQLKHKKYISYPHKSTKEVIEITEEGKQRLLNLIPQYRRKRSWDSRMYLVTYDVPESHKRHREFLRSFLKRLGCAMLQESVWITPYNPRKTIQIFCKDYDLSGVVIVSDMGKDAVIGEIDIQSLIRSLYKLDKINDRYAKYIKLYGTVKKPRPILATAYLSILRDDPQLPHALLPNNWLGEKAHAIFHKFYGDIYL